MRPWRDGDAPALYSYAKDPAVGPAAGWPVHTSVENSRRVIRDVLSAKETYAVVFAEKSPSENASPVGSIGIMVGKFSSLGLEEDEGEIGYWIGVPFWGCGLIPEAVRALMRRAFEDLHLKTLWCGYYDGNEKSRRAQEKCGFRYHHTKKNVPCPLLNEVRTEHITRIAREEWEKNRARLSARL